MKKLKEKRAKKLLFLLLAIISITFTICMLTSPTKTAGATVAMAIVVGGVTLEGDAEKVETARNERIARDMSLAFKDFESNKLSGDEFNKKIALALKGFDLSNIEAFEKLQQTVLDLKEAEKNMGIELKGYREGTHEQALSVKAQFEKTITDRADEWKRFVNFKEHQGNAPWFNLDLNFKTAPGSMTMAGGYATPATYLPAAAYEPGVIPIPRATPVIAISMNYSGTSKAHIVFVEKITPGGTVVAVTENTTFQQVSFIFSAVSSTAKKYPGYTKVSQEMLTDIDFVMAAIQNELKIVIDLAVDADVLLGAGSGDNVKGIGIYASSFTWSISGVAKQSAPNRADAIAAVATQIKNSYFNPNALFINPGDKTSMLSAKASTAGTYLLYPWMGPDGKTFGELTVIETPLIAAGSFLVCDTTKFQVREYIPFNVQMGWETADFINDMVTIRGSRRLHTFMGTLETASAVYDSFATVISAITT